MSLYSQAQVIEDVAIEVPEIVVVDIDQLITSKAKEYGVSRSVMYNTMKCENRDFDTMLQSYVVKDGVREDSWGLAQIHLPSHPNITKAQAQDPEFSINFIAKEMSEGRAWKWSCWRKLYGN